MTITTARFSRLSVALFIVLGLFAFIAPHMVFAEGEGGPVPTPGGSDAIAPTVLSASFAGKGSVSGNTVTIDLNGVTDTDLAQGGSIIVSEASTLTALGGGPVTFQQGLNSFTLGELLSMAMGAGSAPSTLTVQQINELIKTNDSADTVSDGAVTFTATLADLATPANQTTLTFVIKADKAPSVSAVSFAGKSSSGSDLTIDLNGVTDSDLAQGGSITVDEAGTLTAYYGTEKLGSTPLTMAGPNPFSLEKLAELTGQSLNGLTVAQLSQFFDGYSQGTGQIQLQVAVTDASGNTSAQQTITIKADKTKPTATVAQSGQTITYTFSEPVRLTSQVDDSVVSPSEYKNKLSIYELQNYQSYVQYGQYKTPDPDPIPVTVGTVTDATFDSTGKILTIKYDGSLERTTDTRYLVDAWGYNIADYAGNKIEPSDSQIFTISTFPPTVTKLEHSESAKTIEYTFSEPVQLVKQADPGAGTVTALDKSLLGIYSIDAQGNYGPQKVPGVDIIGATLNGNVLAVTYTGNLVQKVPTTYVVDAWGYSIVDMAGNKIAKNGPNQVITIDADTNAPTTTVAHNEDNNTITYSFNEPVELRDSVGTVILPTDGNYATYLGIYDAAAYADHQLYDPAPAKIGTITNATLSSDAKTLTIRYSGSLVNQTDTSYVVDAWGYKIVDLAGNRMVSDASQMFMIPGDITKPTVTEVHYNGTENTITYEFSEPVELRDSAGVIIPAEQYASKLGIYELSAYAAHVYGQDAPAKIGEIQSAELSSDGKVMKITYAGSLIRHDDTEYVVDAWGSNITDVVGNKMAADAGSQRFTVAGDITAPTATVDHNEVTKTISYTFSEPVHLVSQATGITTPLTPELLKIYAIDPETGNYDLDTIVPGISIESAVLSGNDTVLVIKYSGSLVKQTKGTYLADTWGYSIEDAVGNPIGKDVTIGHQIFEIAADTTAPEITIGSYTTDPTNQDITVTAETNEGTLNTTSHKFEQNGSFDFVATDDAGNVATSTVTITNIDKVLPTATVSYDKTGPTNTDVVATITPNKTVTGNLTHTFTDNGTFTFSFTDAAGNTGTAVATVNNIDKDAPVIMLNGLAEVTVSYGDSYTDAGARTDDGSTVVTTGSVNTSVVTDYTLTYNATDAAGNYATQVTRTVHVVQRDITITADAKTKVYGTSDPELTYQITSGSLVNGDSFSGALTRDTGENVGSYAITQDSVTAGGNYDLSFVSGNLVITPATASITVTPYSVTYDGNAHTATVTATGVGGINLSADVGLSGTTHTNAGTYTTDAWSFSNPNYASQSDTVEDAIAKAGATIHVYGYNNLPQYDGTEHVSDGSATGVNGEPLAGLDISSTKHTNAGDYTDAWTFTDLTGNYNNRSDDTVRNIITQAPITVTADDASKTYHADDPASFSYVSSGQLYGTDTFTGSLARVSGETVGTYDIQQGTLGLSNNYAITFNKGTFTIKDTIPPVITLTGDAYIDISRGDTYTDQGATATDDVDPTVTVISSGTVDTNEVGIYSITYTATDTAQNTSTATRTVRVWGSHSNGGGSGSGSTGASAPTGGTTSGGEVLGAAAYNFTQSLSTGSTGGDVTELQNALIAGGYLHIGAPTGFFGPLTQTALRAYQAANNLPQSGIMDDATRALLNQGTTPTSEAPTLTDAARQAIMTQISQLLAQLHLIEQQLAAM